jgi:hypothetical protein
MNIRNVVRITLAKKATVYNQSLLILSILLIFLERVARRRLSLRSLRNIIISFIVALGSLAFITDSISCVFLFTIIFLSCCPLTVTFNFLRLVLMF